MSNSTNRPKRPSPTPPPPPSSHVEINNYSALVEELRVIKELLKIIIKEKN